jgi:KDO2-lipid IV(A) lauroyltransferase
VRARDVLVYVAARLAIGVAARVPQWLGYRAAAALGRVWFRLDGRRRRYACEFLAQAYPELSERGRLRLGAAATASLFMVPLDMARLTRLLDRGGDLSEVIDLAPMQTELEKVEAPYLALTAHIGGWEVGAAGMAALNGSAHGIARVTKNPLLNRWLLATRQRGGLTIHPRRGGFRGLANALAAGGIGLQVVDQNQRLRGVFAPFFGKVASCERAAVSLALRRGYPLVFGAAIRKGTGFRFELIAEPTLYLEKTGDREADLYQAVCQVNASLERMIRRAPAQYLWIHDRYRTQPQADGVAPERELGAD